MAAIAKVIVDVPTMQTDQPYDYLIPADLAAVVKPGMRVVVNFGKGKREVTGMVVDLAEEPEFAGEVKPIVSVIDLAPVLTPEMLALSSWLATSTFAFRITSIQTMLPAMMKANMEKLAIPVAHSEAVQAMFGQQPALNIADITDIVQLKQLMALEQAGEVETVYRVAKKGHAKHVIVIDSLVTEANHDEFLASVRKGATKQIALLDALLAFSNSQKRPTTTEVAAEFSRAQLNQAKAKGWLKLTEQEVYRNPYPEQFPATQPKTLTADQSQVVDQVVAAVSANRAETFLLEGVTGSGKTEVYLQTMAAALQAGKTALMLVPEIALTPQMVNRVKGRFGSQVAVLHSGLSDGEKYDEWRRIARHEVQVVVGARSAAFAPLDNIGVIIMDEEHETSYKQEDNPRYHARDVLAWRSRFHHAPLVLGSATPALESRARAQKGVYTLLNLPNRINQRPMPKVAIVDMRAIGAELQGDFSPALLQALQTRLDRHEQSVLLLNRRGFSSFVMCRDCGFVKKCPNCDISLTLHMDTHRLKCHYCGHEEAIPTTCPNCGSRQIRYYGTGTQKVETTLKTLLPEARILRMDVDTTKKKGAHAKLLKQFGQHEADILLGTQMIAKGLDFPDVTLVGVINADTALGLPDFRASEHTFQLLTQVSGRAGRADKPGEVIIQSFNPEHYAIQFAQHHDYEGFYQQEMFLRHQGDYPPYYYTVKATISHEDENEAAKAAFSLAKSLKSALGDDTIMLGPTPGSIARLKNRYYYQIVLKYKQPDHLVTVLNTLRDQVQTSSRQGFQISFDREPQSFI
ncbi:primosomal protein N' [Lacticaseibacillus brantae]|uniref:Replication restart protein PriA n=1 Tax=Lacticaseibacillus brantae DSM 23927 TaxID=1423727 RepID=A0A0R2B8T6_9LACO|nr:primosomal protein N' [Lacticaseibacillus brantae]KRM72809.1 primosomal replication protein n [Lacticaseibacillus brantae DSM 23927]